MPLRSENARGEGRNIFVMGLNPEFKSLRRATRYPRAPVLIGLIALSVLIAVTGWRVTEHLRAIAESGSALVAGRGDAGGLANPVASSGVAAPTDLTGRTADVIDIMPVSMAERQTRIYRLLAASPLNFARHSAELPPTADAVLTEVARELSDTELLVRIRGHTDSEGLPEYRLELSRARAESVRAALILYGVSDERVLVEALAAREPLASNASAEGRAQNRRVELLLREARG